MPKLHPYRTPSTSWARCCRRRPRLSTRVISSSCSRVSADRREPPCSVASATVTTALTQSVREHLQREEAHQPDAVFAEIVHLPEGRIGNILLRPVLRGYEIPFLGHSGAPEDRRIPITDLLVTVVGDEAMLFSRRLRRRVLPRLTTAHNYQLRGLGIYRFLCSLPYQNVCGGLSWNWGPFDSLPQLPRVVYGRTILRPAIWNVGRDEWQGWQQDASAKRQNALEAWRTRRGLPRRVLLADGDNELFIDFENPLSVEAAHAIVKERPSFRLLGAAAGCGEGASGRAGGTLCPRADLAVLALPRRDARRCQALR